MKKIFITIPWFHPAYKAGGPIQSIANMVEQMGSGQWAVGSGQLAEGSGQLAKSSWQLAVSKEQLAVGSEQWAFSILCSNRDLDGSLLNVETDKWVDHSENTRVWYSSTNNLVPVLKKEIKEDAGELLFINGIYSWPYNLRPLLFCKGVKKIVSARGMLHPGALSQKPFKKKIYLWTWKLMGLHKNIVFHATDEEEKKHIRAVFGNNVNIKIAANFPRVFPLLPLPVKPVHTLKLVSVALISPMKNILLVLEALAGGGWQLAEGSWQWAVSSGQLAKGSRQRAVGSGQGPVGKGQLAKGSGQRAVGSGQLAKGNIEYNIYGPVKEEGYWQECLAVIQKMPPHIKVKYHGDIAPAEIVNVLAQNHVFILPSKSENFGHAIYEALSAGRPVITSNTTPWNKLEAAKAGINVSLQDKQELVNAIALFAAMDQAQLNEWSTAAHDYALKAVDMDTIRKQYAEMFSC